VVTHPAIPAALEWIDEPATWQIDDNGTLAVEAGPRTDVFVSPHDGNRYDNAPRLLAEVSGDFQLSARVTVAFGTRFDAGVLLAWASHERWAKLCFEQSPQGLGTIVSVVNRGVSDDANGWAVDGDTVWLRISRIGPAYAMHASTDGATWSLVRHFALNGSGGAVRVGFQAQSPHGNGCRVRFDDIRFTTSALPDLRDGS
jgi:regulation of enolase protein 1 (concanavalin A-like superfamily)